MRPFAFALALFSAALLFDLSIAAAQPAGVEASVVKLSVTKREPDFFRPWTKASPTKVSGSGVVISGARILT
ncbi:MAG TPA: hypothetical protein VEQ85_09300, partial [Lacipirellulaceae bacterium]|nr:hypothetical protein [Lacipirellulaceae bacterium]